MAYTREHVREAVERAGDEYWQALIRRHEDAYPASRPTPGDVGRAEAERLNQLGLGDAGDLTLVETRGRAHRFHHPHRSPLRVRASQGSPADGAVRGVRKRKQREQKREK
jgi:hypothetical protein